MSVEDMTSKALWSVVALKVAGDTVWAAASAARTVAVAANTLGNVLDCYGRTCLMVESHFGKRYEDITGRNLGAAASAPRRHAMHEDELIREGDEDES